MLSSVIPAGALLIVPETTVPGTRVCVYPLGTAVPFWGQTADNLSALSSKRDCSPEGSVPHELLINQYRFLRSYQVKRGYTAEGWRPPAALRIPVTAQRSRTITEPRPVEVLIILKIPITSRFARECQGWVSCGTRSYEEGCCVQL